MITLAIVAAALAPFSVSMAQESPERPRMCKPCAGILVGDPVAAKEALDTLPALPEEATFYVGWSADLSSPSPRDSTQIDLPGVIPWQRVVFRTTSPLLQNVVALDAEIARLAELARSADDDVRFQLDWLPSGTSAAMDEAGAREYAFLIKRAAVAISGARPDAQVFTADLPTSSSYLQALYSEEVAAYVDGVTFSATSLAEGDLERAVEELRQLDPGVAIAVEGRSSAADPYRPLIDAAQDASLGASLSLFETTDLSAERLRPLLLLAREFRGDLSADPYSVPTGTDAWSFVRGEDLGLRVVVRSPPGAEQLTLTFTDRQITSPATYDPETLEESMLFGGRRTRDGYVLDLETPPPVVVLKLDRVTRAELEGSEGVEERVDVEDVRTMPVEEILRRLQAFEDAQRRQVQTYTAINSLSLRFQAGAGTTSLDTTFRGDFFYREGEGYDWAWQEFFVNGVRWRNKRIPKIPLFQPEKASAMPADITFTREYRYRLRGDGEAQGRDCWVVDFEPAVAVEPGRTLFQGTVWIDKELFARVKTSAVQLGLVGDVTSNQETRFFSPIDASGAPAAWEAGSIVLPLRLTGQQIFSVLDVALVVERQIEVTNVAINPPDFEERREVILASEATMVRDTDEGLRYLEVDKETGERVVAAPDPTRFFLVGGVFYDQSQDFPVPLAGVNWINFDWKGTGAQYNVFFGGLLVIADVATPSLFGSRWSAGADGFLLAIPGTDTAYRDGVEAPSEDVEFFRPSIDLSLGRPIGNFFRVEFEYSLGFNRFDTTSDTAEDFVVPQDHIDHNFTIGARYIRKGYRLNLSGTYSLRSDWDFWGLPGNTEYDPAQDQYTRWSAGIAKTWFLPRFQQFGVQANYFDGNDLDRFSKYEFGPFSDVRVQGYSTARIRAEKAYASRVSYGVNLAEVVRADLIVDAAWATDEASGLDNELLSGVGVAGSFVGPWRSIVRLDVGVPVVGPETGFTAFVTFLKLFG